jgi:hypothetical protein
MYTGPHIVTNGLEVLLDVNNTKCVDPTQTLTGTGDTIKNLIDTSLTFYPYDYPNMTFVLDNNLYVYEQNGINGGDPGWVSNSGINQVENYTFSCWVKYRIGLDYQRAENIYLGGFNSRSCFRLTSGGVTANSGILRFDHAGGNSTAIDSNFGTYDNNWHQFTSVDTGGDGDHTIKFYLDGVYKTEVKTNETFIVPYGNNLLTWGSWSIGYGNFNGRSNYYMYYSRALSDKEVMQNYISTKYKFGKK